MQRLIFAYTAVILIIVTAIGAALWMLHRPADGVRAQVETREVLGVSPEMCQAYNDWVEATKRIGNEQHVVEMETNCRKHLRQLMDRPAGKA